MALNYGVVSKANVELIEDQGFKHFFPGSRVFSLGGYGFNLLPPGPLANFAALPAGEALRSLNLEKLADFTIQRQCRGVLFTFNEPGMWFEYLVDAAKTIKANGMYTAMTTNGFLTRRAVEFYGDYMDGVRVEISALSENTFQRLTGQKLFQKVLDFAIQAKRRFKAHLEISTTLVPGINDSPGELKRIAGWIKLALGETTPWHISSLDPALNGALSKAKQLGKEMGLHYIYISEQEAPSTFSPPSGDDPKTLSFDPTAEGQTFCYNCHSLLIERPGQKSKETRIVGLDDSKCQNCKVELNIRNTIWKLK